MISVQVCPSKLRSGFANAMIRRDNEERTDALTDDVERKPHG
jgi:hypothetical protein